MASSSNPTDRRAETGEDDEATDSRFVVGPDELKKGDFKTLDDAREMLDEDGEE